MTGITVSIEIEDGAARARLDAIIRRLDNPLGLYKNIGDHMVNSTTANFKAENSPEGVPWAKLRPSTIRNRIRKRRSSLGILRASGKLIGSINARPTATEVTIGTPAHYAAVHQLGASIERQARTGRIWRKQRKDGTFEPLFRKRKLKTSVATEVQVPAHTTTIPARPFLGVSKADEIAIIEIARAWLLGR